MTVSKRLILIGCVLATVILAGCTEEKKSDYIPVTQFDPARNAALDVQQAALEAQHSNRRILLDVGGNWCIWCRKLDTFFEENKDVKQFMDDHFVVVKINYSKENKNEAFLSQFPKIPGYPHFFVLNPEGKLLHSQDTGQLEEGKGHDHDKVLSFLKEWAADKS